ncbi:hypothetical protein IFM58399_01840 [Aspergillus lentulus]|uniref:uncharacterized protein n=1 Tax=Aspergillus lentulus TaxID=293939 RepID=UPI0013936A8F|nr:uncharacterized protein IFM58399_01840 [Aspergillus lentulus]GFF27933.1 hypothetical protein IFM58399_01840 [Aspergillus lentulus]GFF47902.1 hypothetical protein IFM62136_00881 [Aspergillus lentulus]GFG02741.1 hypothetical protein IFM61392_02445 [Aspergillus lentulus]
MTAFKFGMTPKKGAPSRKRALVLPIIAPKDDHTTSIPIDTSMTEQTPLPRPRSRFPPRSRTGCWTCRSRKVKCDEGHPQCNQCSRLGHICDYRPRLSFRDDTRRTIERMSDIKIAGNTVWDPNACPQSKNASSDSATHDLLPPFPLLATDEERERKAETSRPGTYHVIVIPESFTHLPEYIDDPSDEELGDSIASPLCGNTETAKFTNNPELEDSNVVILRQFKDSKRSSSSQCRTASHSPTSDLRESSLSAATIDATSQNAADDDPILLDMLEQDSLEAILLGHFRDVVWMQLVPAGGIFNFAGGSSLDAAVFDREATNFPPLFHAMMAISALSLDRKSGSHSIDALNYYHLAFLSLQSSIWSEEDLLLDGLFLTHFLLLAYELAAAELDGSSLWSHHISRLLHISALRRSTFGTEPYPHIIWWVCSVDLYALLSGAGTGAFVQEAMENPDLLPGHGASQQSMHVQSYRSVSLEDRDSLIVLRLYHDTFKLAARLGFLAAESRRINLPFPCSHQDQRQREVCEWRGALWLLWNSPEAQFLARAQESLPLFLQEILWQTSLLYHTSLLFSYTSLWPGQCFGPGAAPQEEVRHHAAAVFSIAESVIAQSKENCWRSVAFPVFLAGSVTPSSDLKVIALDMLSRLEVHEIGRNATSIRYLFQVVYERQMQQSQDVGHPGSADWMEILAEHGLPLVASA